MPDRSFATPDNPIADAAQRERARLVRFCAYLTGVPHAAEDLAQETLFEAWRHAHELRDPGRRAQWLAGIARNVCRRWARSRAQELSRLNSAGPFEALSLEHLPADDFDLEAELERKELAELLDRALALIPPPTRDVLVARYIEETPQKEVARRLGISERTVGVRLQRGKLYLRRMLTGTLIAEAAAY